MQRLLCLLSNMNIGGAETFLMKVYRTLDRAQYQLDFCIHVEEKCDYEDEICSLGGRIFRIPSKSQNAKEFKKQLTNIIRQNRYRRVLKITSNAAGFWDLKIAKKAGAECAIARSSNASDGDSLIQKLTHKLGRWLWMKYVDVKIAPSDLAAAYTFGRKALKRGEVHFLNNGLDLEVFRYSVEGRQTVRDEFGIADSTAVLGHIGRFNTQKNHAFLLCVFADYLKKDPDAVLILVGVGDLENDIRRLAAELRLADKVIFAGLRTDIPALLSAFDVFVFPSLYEGMPNTVIEAQACSLPCVISDTITEEADICGKVAYLPLNNTSEWASAIYAAVSGGRITADMSAYDIKTVSQKFIRYCYGL